MADRGGIAHAILRSIVRRHAEVLDSTAGSVVDGVVKVPPNGFYRR